MGKGLVEMERSSQVIIDHYRCPEEFVRVRVQGNLSEQAGFFKLGSELVCYGRSSAFAPSLTSEQILNDALDYVRTDHGGVVLPFDVGEAVSALRCERYIQPGNGAGSSDGFSRIERAGYYAIRPVMPVAVRKHLQKYSLRNWNKREFPRWPVDTSVEAIMALVMTWTLRTQKEKEIPFIWFWPEGAQACAVMTHDVESLAGRDFCDRLMDIDDSYGIKASFQVVPERRYAVPDTYLKNISERGFEIDVHDLNHDGNLYENYEEFQRRAAAINMYGKKFRTRGFRAGVLYRNISWYDWLDFDYDMSVPNVAHLDPQHGGCCTTFPYFIGKMLEIPVTLTQDYTLFNILCDYRLDLWETQMAVIREKHGVMSFIIHPDYIHGKREQFVYTSLLARLSKLRESDNLWIPLPRELNKWWRQRSQMQLVRNGSGWMIAGDGKERARIAYARLENDKLVYTL